MSCAKNFILVTLCTQTMFSVLVFMCRDPGDTTSKVLCCVEPSYCFKNRDFDAIVKVPPALPLKMSLSRKRKYSKSLKCLFRRHYAFVRRFDLSTFTNKASVAFWQEFDFNFTYQLYVFFSLRLSSECLIFFLGRRSSPSTPSASPACFPERL